MDIIAFTGVLKVVGLLVILGFRVDILVLCFCLEAQ